MEKVKRGGVVKEMILDDKALRKLQLTQVEILDEIVRVCNNLEIDYYLAYGTLLGAVRHKGFIPWDDDLDIQIKRDDYNKFVKYAPKELSSKYMFVDANTEKNYGLCYGKVVKKDTLYLEYNAPKKLCNGIFVDVFPLETLGDVASEGNDLLKNYCRYKQFLLAKCGYRLTDGSLKNNIRCIMLKAASAMYTKKKLLEKIAVEEEKIRSTGKNYVDVISSSSYGYGLKKHLPADWYSDNVYLEFERKQYKCPKYWHEVLTEEYGDYMQLPPVESRQNRHLIVKLDFDTSLQEKNND